MGTTTQRREEVIKVSSKASFIRQKHSDNSVWAVGSLHYACTTETMLNCALCGGNLTHFSRSHSLAGHYMTRFLRICSSLCHVKGYIMATLFCFRQQSSMGLPWGLVSIGMQAHKDI